MILWLNGTFGVGKTSTARAIRQAQPSWRLFDPETIGYMLTANLGDQQIDDFQDLAAWRSLVPQVAAGLALRTGANLIASQTVLAEPYWRELTGGMTAVGLDVFHVLLDCDEATLRDRIHRDEVERGAEGWRIKHLTAYAQARPWLLGTVDAAIDTSAMSPDVVAARVLSAMR